MPKVSVIIPTYNGHNVIPATVESVLAQTKQDLEVIVIDHGPTDDTRAVIKGIKDSRVKYFYKDSEAVGSARNYGLSKANGEYIAFLDHDDLWPENYIEVMISHLENNSEFGAAYSPIMVVYPDAKEVKSYKRPEGKSGWITLDLFRNSFVWTSATVIRKFVLEKFFFDEALKRSYEDGDYFLRLSMRTQYLFVDGVQVIKREHDKSWSYKIGVQPTRILVLERFYFSLGGDKIIPAKVAKRRISHAYRKVAKARCREGNRSAAIALYKRAIKYWPIDLRLYLGLGRTLLLSRKKDPNPRWQMPEPLSAI